MLQQKENDQLKVELKNAIKVNKEMLKCGLDMEIAFKNDAASKDATINMLRKQIAELSRQIDSSKDEGNPHKPSKVANHRRVASQLPPKSRSKVPQTIKKQDSI